MGRKRKAKKRRAPSSARKRRRRRTSSHPRRISDPSSDADFNIEDENSDHSDDDDDDVDFEDEDENDEISILACTASGTRTRNSRNSRPRRASKGDSDDDFDIDLQRALEKDFLERDMNAVPYSSSEGIVTKVESSVSENEKFHSSSLQPESTCHDSRPDITTSDTAENYGAEDEKRKGKQKVFEEDENMNSHEVQEAGETGQLCGVCLTEKTLIERGKLDCCDHFFCFGCIMEWAKVESRCPMCKQRFVTIVKHSSPGKRTRTVRIPTRNQIYIPPEEMTTEDPYADVVCMECQGTGDEGLLLLCDQCDAAAHTFCVGLGMSVPRGDWFCRVCQASKADEESDEDEELTLTSETENLGSEEDEDSILRAIVASPQTCSYRPRKSKAQTSSSIISRSRLSNVAPRRRVRSSIRKRILRRLSSRRRDRTSVRLPPSAVSASAQASERPLCTSQNTHVSELSNASARTVPQQRKLQERIHIMRSNWNRIQTGDLQFDAICRQASDSSTIVQGMKIPTEAVERSKSNLEPGESSSKKELEQAWQMMSSAQKLLERNLQKSDSSIRQINQQVVQPLSNSPIAVETACQNQSDSNVFSKGSSVDDSSHAGTRTSYFKNKDKDDAVENDVTRERSRTNNLNKFLSMQVIKPSEMIKNSEKVNDVNNPHKNENSRGCVETHGSASRSKRAETSSSHEGLKVHLTELVKKQIWPSYLAERLDKEQFKQIARCAVYTLLEFCDSGSAILSCNHLDDRCRSPLEMCCKKCLNLHVEKAVKAAKDKIVPS